MRSKILSKLTFAVCCIFSVEVTISVPWSLMGNDADSGVVVVVVVMDRT